MLEPRYANITIINNVTNSCGVGHYYFFLFIFIQEPQIPLIVCVVADFRILVARVAGLVGHFKHSTKATGKLKDVMVGLADNMETLQNRNDTRWISTYNMFSSVASNKVALQTHFLVHEPNCPLQLSECEWEEVRCALGVLAAHSEVNQEIQGGPAGYVSTCIEAYADARQMMQQPTIEVQTWQSLDNTLKQVCLLSKDLGSSERSWCEP